MTTDIRGVSRFAALAAAVLAGAHRSPHTRTARLTLPPKVWWVRGAVTFPGSTPDTIAVRGDADHGFIRAPSCAARVGVRRR